MKSPYDLQNYELIYVIMKPIAKDHVDVDQTYLKWSRKRNSYYFSGRVVTFDVRRKDGTLLREYPKPGRISLVPVDLWEAFNASEESKESNAITIHLSYVDYIILDNSSFHLYEKH